MTIRPNLLLPKNNFIRNVSIMAGGALFGQLLVVVVSPLLTRIYTPDDFGVLAVFSALLAVLTSIGSLRYELAIPLPEDDTDAAHIIALCLSVLLASVLLVTVTLFFWGTTIFGMLNVPELSSYGWLLPIGLVLSGTYSVFNFWAMRTKLFSSIARTKLSQAVSTVAIQLGAHGFGPLGLLVAQVAGQAVGITSLLSASLRKKPGTFRQLRAEGISAVARRYRRFPIYSTWGVLFNTVSTNAAPIMFAAFFGSAAAGLFALALRVLALPASVVGNAIANVFYSDAAEVHRRGELGTIVVGIHEKLAKITMPPLVIVLLAGPDIFAFVFGENWREAGVLAQWMTPWLYLSFVSSPLSTSFSVLEMQARSTSWNALILLTRTFAIYLGYVWGSFYDALIWYSLASAACYLILSVMIFRAVNASLLLLARNILYPIVFSFVSCSPIFMYEFLQFDSVHIIYFVLMSIVIISGYYVYMAKYWNRNKK